MAESNISNEISETTVLPAPSSPFSNGWKYRKELTIDSSKVDGDLSEWPLAVHLDSDNELSSGASSDGSDIRFEDTNGNQLSHEIESYDSSTGTLWAHVKIPSVSASEDTKLYLYYGNPDANNQENVSDVWSNGYDGVYHMGESGDTVINSVGTDGSYTGGSSTSGVIDKATDFTGDDDYATLGKQYQYDDTDDFTVSAWVNTNQVKLNDRVLGFVTTDGFGFIYLNFDTGNDELGFRADGSVYLGQNKGVAKVSDGDTHVAVRCDGGSRLSMVENGVEIDSATSFSWGEQNNTFALGDAGQNDNVRWAGEDDNYNGIIDEVRISPVNRSDAWMSASYANQNNPTSFYSVGSQESVGVATTYSDGTVNLSWNNNDNSSDGGITVSRSKTPDYNNEKPLTVTSVSGSPTVSRSVPVKIASGDSSTTGTGKILLDWTNIAERKDITVVDENGDTLDYFIESFDSTSETAIIHVYNDWVRDGTTQAKILYGDGPKDRSSTSETVFDNESSLTSGLLLNESSGDAIDVTSNNNNATVNGATQNASGLINGAYEFDGNNDYLSFSNSPDLGDSGAISIWVNPTNDTNSTIFSHHSGDNDRAYFGINMFDACSTGEIFAALADGGAPSCTGVTADTNQWNHFVFQWQSDGSYQFYKNGIQKDSGSYTGTMKTDVVDWEIGRYTRDDDQYFAGKIDTVNIYSSSLSPDAIEAKYNSSKSNPEFFSQEASVTTSNEFNDIATELSPDTTSYTDSAVSTGEYLFKVKRKTDHTVSVSNSSTPVQTALSVTDGANTSIFSADVSISSDTGIATPDSTPSISLTNVSISSDTGIATPDSTPSISSTNVSTSIERIEYITIVTEGYEDNVLFWGDNWNSVDWAADANYGDSITDSNISTLQSKEIILSPASNLTTSATTVGEISLSWTVGSGEDGYYIYRAESTGSTTSDYTQIDSVGSGSTSYTDTTVKDGEKYFYRVSSFNAIRESELSNESNVVTILSSPNGLSSTRNSDTISLSWNDTTNGENKFVIYRATTSGSTQSDYTIVSTISSNSTSYTDSVTNSEEYYYRVSSKTEHTESLSSEIKLLFDSSSRISSIGDSLSANSSSVSSTPFRVVSDSVSSPISATSLSFSDDNSKSVASTADIVGNQQFAETGSVYITGSEGITNAANSRRIIFDKVYDNPVVMAHMTTTNGGQNVEDNVTDIEGGAATIFNIEPELEGHASETHSYFVFEQGVHRTPEGYQVEAGTHTSDNPVIEGDLNPSGDTIEFTESFDNKPVVLATINSHNSGDFKTAWINNVTKDSFELNHAVDSDASTATEEVGWVAIESGITGTIGGTTVETEITTSSSTSFESFDSKPNVIVDWQESGDSGWADGSSLSSTSENWGLDYNSGGGDTFGHVAFADGSTVLQNNDTSFSSDSVSASTSSGSAFSTDEISSVGEASTLSASVGTTDTSFDAGSTTDSVGITASIADTTPQAGSTSESTASFESPATTSSIGNVNPSTDVSFSKDSVSVTNSHTSTFGAGSDSSLVDSVNSTNSNSSSSGAISASSSSDTVATAGSNSDTTGAISASNSTDSVNSVISDSSTEIGVAEASTIDGVIPSTSVSSASKASSVSSSLDSVIVAESISSVIGANNFSSSTDSVANTTSLSSILNTDEKSIVGGVGSISTSVGSTELSTSTSLTTDSVKITSSVTDTTPQSDSTVDASTSFENPVTTSSIGNTTSSTDVSSSADSVTASESISSTIDVTVNTNSFDSVNSTNTSSVVFSSESISSSVDSVTSTNSISSILSPDEISSIEEFASLSKSVTLTQPSTSTSFTVDTALSTNSIGSTLIPNLSLGVSDDVTPTTGFSSILQTQTISSSFDISTQTLSSPELLSMVEAAESFDDSVTAESTASVYQSSSESVSKSPGQTVPSSSASSKTTEISVSGDVASISPASSTVDITPSTSTTVESATISTSTTSIKGESETTTETTSTIDTATNAISITKSGDGISKSVSTESATILESFINVSISADTSQSSENAVLTDSVSDERDTSDIATTSIEKSLIDSETVLRTSNEVAFSDDSSSISIGESNTVAATGATVSSEETVIAASATATDTESAPSSSLSISEDRASSIESISDTSGVDSESIASNKGDIIRKSTNTLNTRNSITESVSAPAANSTSESSISESLSNVDSSDESVTQATTIRSVSNEITQVGIEADTTEQPTSTNRSKEVSGSAEEPITASLSAAGIEIIDSATASAIGSVSRSDATVVESFSESAAGDDVSTTPSTTVTKSPTSSTGALDESVESGAVASIDVTTNNTAALLQPVIVQPRPTPSIAADSALAGDDSIVSASSGSTEVSISSSTTRDSVVLTGSSTEITGAAGESSENASSIDVSNTTESIGSSVTSSTVTISTESAKSVDSLSSIDISNEKTQTQEKALVGVAAVQTSQIEDTSIAFGRVSRTTTVSEANSGISASSSRDKSIRVDTVSDILKTTNTSTAINIPSSVESLSSTLVSEQISLAVDEGRFTGSKDNIRGTVDKSAATDVSVDTISLTEILLTDIELLVSPGEITSTTSVTPSESFSTSVSNSGTITASAPIFTTFETAVVFTSADSVDAITRMREAVSDPRFRTVRRSRNGATSSAVQNRQQDVDVKNDGKEATVEDNEDRDITVKDGNRQE